MSLPKVLTRVGTDRIIIGMTNIYIKHASHSVMVTHAGNPEDTYETIEKHFDMVLGSGRLKELRSKAKKETENGDPSYLYTLIMEF